MMSQGFEGEAIAYKEAGNEQGAHEAALQAYKLDPSNDKAWLLQNITTVHVPSGFHFLAGDQAVAPGDEATLEKMVGFVYDGSKPFEDWLGSQDRAIDLTGMRAKPAYFNQTQASADALARQGDLSSEIAMGDAEKAYEQTKAELALHPNSPQAQLNAANAALITHRTEEAISLARAVLKTHPKDAPALGLLATADNIRDDPQAALQDSQAAIDADPNYASGWLERGKARKALGQEPQVYLADFKRSAELNPALEPAYEAAAQLALAPQAGAAPMGAVSLPRIMRQAVALAIGLSLIIIVLVILASSRRARGAVAADAPLKTLPGMETVAPGAVVAGQYEIESVLGQGGMGVVYGAKDLKLKRRVALKRLSAELRGNPVELKRFEDEATTLARFKHPNILMIYSFADHGTDRFIVSEYVDGETLHERLGRFGRLTPQECLRQLEGVCAGLDYAHSRGVIHRDLKPSNIMVEDGQPKLADFGIARVTSSPDLRTNTDSQIGTPSFMAPEQFYGSVSKESDLYALGVCAYQMLTGKLPFEGAGMMDAKLSGRFGEEALASQPELKGFFTQALNARPEQRFHSAQEFLAAFKAAIGRTAV